MSHISLLIGWECHFTLLWIPVGEHTVHNLNFICGVWGKKRIHVVHLNILAFANAKISHVSVLLRVLKGTALGLVSLSSCRRLRRSSSSPQEKNHSRETQLFMWPELSTSSVSFKKYATPHFASEDIQKARKIHENFSLKFGNSCYAFVLALTIWPV